MWCIVLDFSRQAVARVRADVAPLLRVVGAWRRVGLRGRCPTTRCAQQRGVAAHHRQAAPLRVRRLWRRPQIESRHRAQRRSVCCAWTQTAVESRPAVYRRGRGQQSRFFCVGVGLRLRQQSTRPIAHQTPLRPGLRVFVQSTGVHLRLEC